MIVREAKLVKDVFVKDIEFKKTRDGFGEALLEIAEKNKDLVVLTADLKGSTRVTAFAENYTDRFVEVGVAEQALATIASGMANYGKIPFITSFAMFSPGRNWEQIRTTICLNNVPVKIAGSHAGFSAAADGATHQALEDIALTRVLPNMVVVVPCDFEEVKKATKAVIKNKKPSYVRFNREDTAVVTKANTNFKIGKAELFWKSKNPLVAIIASGPLVYDALLAAKSLEKSQIEVLVYNNHTIKPVDEKEIIKAAKITGAVVTVEEHQISGGMGSAVAEILAQKYPVPIEFVGVKDQFGESGKYKELLKKHSLDKEGIIEAVKAVIKRKVNN